MWMVYVDVLCEVLAVWSCMYTLPEKVTESKFIASFYASRVYSLDNCGGLDNIMKGKTAGNPLACPIYITLFISYSCASPLLHTIICAGFNTQFTRYQIALVHKQHKETCLHWHQVCPNSSQAQLHEVGTWPWVTIHAHMLFASCILFILL